MAPAGASRGRAAQPDGIIRSGTLYLEHLQAPCKAWTRTVRPRMREKRTDVAMVLSRWDDSESRLRLQTAVRLRWFGVAGQLATVSYVYFGLGFNFDIGMCLALIALTAWLNVFFRLRYSMRTRLGTTFATALLAYDIVQLAALLYLTGGIENPFVFLIVAPVTVSAATLPPRNTIALGVLAAAATSLLVFWYRPLPWFTYGGFELPTLYNVGVLASVLAGMIFLALYVWRLAKEARQMSDALAATEMVLAREQQLHALDGLAAAAAHELGTPLSTIAVVAKELARAAPKDGQLRRGHRPAAKPGRALPRDPAQAHPRAQGARPAARAHQRARADRGGGRTLPGLQRRDRDQRRRGARRQSPPPRASPSASAGPASSTGSPTWSRTPSISRASASRSPPPGRRARW